MEFLDVCLELFSCSCVQPSWQAELDVLFYTASGGAGSSVSPTRSSAEVAEHPALARLQGFQSLSALEVLQSNGLDIIGECLNELASERRLDDATVTQLSSILEKVRDFFPIFENALRSDDVLKADEAAQEAARPELEAIKAKKLELLALDDQIAVLQRKRSDVASALEATFEANRARLTELAAGARRIARTKSEKKMREAEITLGEGKWLELKAALKAYLP